MLERPVSIVADVVVPDFITRPPDEPPLPTYEPLTPKMDTPLLIFPATKLASPLTIMSELYAPAKTFRLLSLECMFHH